MRKVTKILIAFVLSSFLCVSLFAQNKIAVIDRNAFEAGVSEVSETIKVYNSKQSLNEKDYKSKYYSLQNKIQKIERFKKPTYKEISQMISLRYELKQAQGQYAATTKKLRKELLSPVWDKIRQFLEIFLSENGYKEIYTKVDGKIIQSRVFDSQFDENNLIDITNEFIKFCNEEFEKEKHKNREK